MQKRNFKKSGHLFGGKLNVGKRFILLEYTTDVIEYAITTNSIPTIFYEDLRAEPQKKNMKSRNRDHAKQMNGKEGIFGMKVVEKRKKPYNLRPGSKRDGESVRETQDSPISSWILTYLFNLNGNLFICLNTYLYIYIYILVRTEANIEKIVASFAQAVKEMECQLQRLKIHRSILDADLHI